MLVVPLSVIANNLSELQYLDFKLTFWSLGVLAVVSAVALTALGWVLSRTVLGVIFVWGIRALFFFLLLTGLLLPLTGASGQISTHQIPTNKMNLVIALFVAAVALLLCRTRIRTPLLLTALLFGAISGGSSAATILMGIKLTGFANLITASSTKNIFVVSFDGVPRDVAREVIDENAGYQRALKDFTVFTNSISTAPSTATSLISEGAGGIDLKAMFGTEKNMVDKVDRSNIITNYLERNNYNVSVYGYYSLIFNDNARAVAPGTIVARDLRQRTDDAGAVFELAVARMITPHFIFGRASADRLASWVSKKWPDEHADQDADMLRRLKNHKGADWDASNIANLQDFHAYVNGLHVGTSEPVAQFMHFLHSHFPVDFDANCVYRSDNADWFKSHQTRNGVKDEVRCNVAQFIDFIAKLKVLGIYDRSTIILKSDHGTAVAYNDPTKMEGFTIRGNSLWGYSRLAPFLAIKPAAAKRDKPMLDARPVVLSDLARTLCHLATPDGGCDRFVGYDLLSSAAIPADATYFVNLVTGPASTYLMDTQQSVEFPRVVPFYDALTDFLTSEMLSNPMACGAITDLTAGKPFNDGRSDYSSWVTWSDSGTTFLKVKAPACATAHGSLAMTIKATEAKSPIHLVISVDGKRIGTLSASEPMGVMSKTINFPAAFPPSSNHTYSVTAEPSGTQLELQSVTLSP
jgi:hypothetical protein